MDPLTANFLFLSFFFTKSVVAEVCYEYKNSNTRAFECADGCCGSSTDAYCCMSPILIVGIVVGTLAGLIMIGVIVFICYQKYKQRQLNKIEKISIDQLSDNPTPRKNKKDKEAKKQAKGGMMTTSQGEYYNKPTMHPDGAHSYNNNKQMDDNPDTAVYPPPPPPVPRTGTWLLNTNNKNPPGKKESTNPPLPPPPPPAPALPWTQPKPPPMGPIPANTTSTAAVFNIQVTDSLPVHPGAAELYADRTPIRPLPGSLPPLPPLQPKN